MAHWFGIKPWEIDDLSYGEVLTLLEKLKKLPPIGSTFLVSKKE